MFSYVGESEFRKEAKEVVLKNEARVPVLFHHDKKLSLRRVFELSKEISQSDNVISKVISTVLNQEIDDNFVDIKWREMTELSDSQKQFVLFVLQAEAALYVTVENQILDEVNEELNETPVEEQTRKVLEAVTSVLYSLSISQMKRDMLQELLDKCYCTICHVCSEQMPTILEQCITADVLLEQQKNAFLTTGCRSIDKCLKGGIPLHSITEV